MEHTPEVQGIPKFSSVEEELRYLRSRVAEKEQQVWQEQSSTTKEEIVSQELHQYAAQTPKEVLAEHFILDNPKFEEVLSHLSSLPHREKMRELYHILAEKGVMNSINLARSLNNPHIEDDFHRVLVGYVHSGAVITGLEKEHELEQSLRMVLYEVALPHQEGQHELTTKDVVDSMERLFVGLLPHSNGGMLSRAPFVFEVAMANFSSDIVFYAAVPNTQTDLFLRQIFSVFPAARVEEHFGDYNIFNEYGVSLAATAKPSANYVYPIQFADELRDDPLKVLLNAFHHIERDGEGAAIQFIMYPDAQNMFDKLKSAIKKIKQGAPLKEATDIPLSMGGELFKAFKGLVKESVKKDAKDQEKPKEFNEKAVELIEQKIEHPLLWANIRIVVSAKDQTRADNIISSLESAFNQFNRPLGNGLRFERAKGSDLRRLCSQYTFRSYREDDGFLLNTRELATMFHFPNAIESKDAPQLKVVKSRSAPAPIDLPREGILLGTNKHRGEAREIRFSKADRLRHFYVIGQTGTGKSVFMKNLAIQDIHAGEGVCFIDPHGNDVQDILANIPKERIDDVIYFDPTSVERPFGLNMLEYDTSHPEQKIFVVNELFSIFKKLYGGSNPESMGPAFEQYFRNATMLVLEDPETGCTLLEISRVLADKNFRALKLSRCKNPIVVQFWREIAEKTSGEAGLANMIPYITNKFDVFLSNDVMRPIVAQEKSSFNFRNIMDTQKILLVNLSKGKLGDINANLIGLILVGKFLMAAMSRVDSFGTKLPDFYLYIDEFQNITTDSISAILSEARKYGLSLNVAHQYIAQLDPKIRDAVFGNVGSMAVFRVGADDAKELESQFSPVFTPEDVMKIDNYNCYLRMLMNNKPVPPFNIETPNAPKGTPEIIPQLKQLSALKYGRDRETVDGAILRKYASTAQTPQAKAPAPTPQSPVPLAQVAFPRSPSQSAPPSVVPQAPKPQTSGQNSSFAQAFANTQDQTAHNAPAIPQQVDLSQLFPPGQNPVAHDDMVSAALAKAKSQDRTI